MNVRVLPARMDSKRNHYREVSAEYKDINLLISVASSDRFEGANPGHERVVQTPLSYAG